MTPQTSKKELKSFQFPTGWNSTDEIEAEKRMERCFNSQRDGILRCPKATNRARFASVSIPNGMEFYSSIFAKFAISSLVSIPNGMEFYTRSIIKETPSKKFQFPTGWNSTVRALASDSELLLFQFPTGWNSTLSPPRLSFFDPRFNSQRDGILLFRSGWDYL